MTSSRAGRPTEPAAGKSRRRHPSRRHRTGWLVASVAVAALLGLGLAPQLPSSGQLSSPPGTSSHADTRSHSITSSLSTLDRNADTTGPIVIGTNGEGYVAWQHPATGGRPDAVLFCVIAAGGKCKKPITLPFPPSEAQYGTDQPFPVLGSEPGVVYVVAPSYDLSNSVIWTSTDGGAKFSAGYAVPGPNYFGGNTQDVLLLPGKPKLDYFGVASVNPGLDFSFTGNPITLCITCSLNFAQASGVLGATLGLSDKGAVEAYWTDADTPTVDFYWSKYDDQPYADAWRGPFKITTGDNARLAGGPKGLFLLSQDFAGHESHPTRLDVRRWDPATDRFGPPMTVVKESSSTESPYIGGLGEDAVTGALYVAWEAYTPKGDVMHLWISSDGGRKWSAAADVAKLSAGDVNEARVAVRKGKGFLTFEDFAGLHLVDLAHL